MSISFAQKRLRESYRAWHLSRILIARGPTHWCGDLCLRCAENHDQVNSVREFGRSDGARTSIGIADATQSTGGAPRQLGWSPWPPRRSRLVDRFAVVPPLAARSEDGLQVHRCGNPARMESQQSYVPDRGRRRPALRGAEQNVSEMRLPLTPLSPY